MGGLGTQACHMGGLRDGVGMGGFIDGVGVGGLHGWVYYISSNV